MKKYLENFAAAIQGIREQMDVIMDSIQEEINTSQRQTDNDEPIKKRRELKRTGPAENGKP